MPMGHLGLNIFSISPGYLPSNFWDLKRAGLPDPFQELISSKNRWCCEHFVNANVRFGEASTIRCCIHNSALVKDELANSNKSREFINCEKRGWSLSDDERFQADLLLFWFGVFFRVWEYLQLCSYISNGHVWFWILMRNFFCEKSIALSVHTIFTNYQSHAMLL